jgi:hypothetical protein
VNAIFSFQLGSRDIASLVRISPILIEKASHVCGAFSIKMACFSALNALV